MLDRMLLSAGGEEKLYVEDVFSTYLYTGNGSTQTITNGIDLSSKGGMVWIKARTSAQNHFIQSTQTSGVLSSNTTSALSTPADFVANSNGFTSSWGTTNTYNYASWTFRKAPKFFDVVKFSVSSTTQRVSHSLGSVPGCIIVKKLGGTDDWYVYHKDLGGTNKYLWLNLTSGVQTYTDFWGTTGPTSTDFCPGFSAAGSGDCIAYLFAHDATADGIIQCGTFTDSGSGVDVNLGWEPQWILAKSTGAGSWNMLDTMRGMVVDGGAGTGDKFLQANTSNAESSSYLIDPTSTGFRANWSGTTAIYIAIRRGPMKTPTSGTSVYNAVSRTGTGATATVNANMTVDLSITSLKGGYSGLDHVVFDRLRGAGRYSATNTTAAEDTFPSDLLTSFATQNGVILGADADPDYNGKINAGGFSYINWYFRRAPGFFDEVCYTGTGNPLTLNHNLGVAPELIIYKARSSGYSWIVQSSAMNVVSDYLILNATSAKGTTMTWRTPTSTTFGVNMSGNVSECNYAGTTYVAYLFASCPGVSKVGSYTGNGTSQTINCGFSSGARFFLVKRTDSTGDWWVYDSARGIVAAADPALRLNSTAAEVTSADAVDTDSTGIIVNQETTCNINVNGGTYIYLAIA